MAAFNDLTSRRFGRLVVISRAENSKSNMTRWLCRCDCGTEKIVSVANLGSNTNSCGCLRNTQGSHSNKHPLWGTFVKMHSRCEKPSDKDFKNYGARGIKVCARWESFPNFLEDMGASHKPGLTLDRKNNSKGYSKSNCRWANAKQQGRNRRGCIEIDTPWGRMNVAEAAERIGVNRERFSTRVSLGWTTEQLFDPRNFGRLTKWDRRRGARGS